MCDGVVSLPIRGVSRSERTRLGLSLQIVSRFHRVDGTLGSGFAGNEGESGEFNEGELGGFMQFQKRTERVRGNILEPGERDVRMK